MSRPTIGQSLVATLLLLACPMTTPALELETPTVIRPFAEGTGLLAPQGFCIDLLRGNLIIADTEANRVLVTDLLGSVRKVLGREGGLLLPTAVAVTHTGTLYIAERGRNTLKVVPAYDSNRTQEAFQLLPLEPLAGSPAVRPKALAVDTEERLYVVDGAGRQILILQPDHSLKQIITRVGQPVDVWTDGETILVADASVGGIRMFSADGRPQRTLGISPSRNAMPVRPRAVVMDTRRRIWVLDEEGNIQVLDILGGTLMNMSGKDLFEPIDLALDLSGDVFVLEKGANQIAAYTVTEF